MLTLTGLMVPLANLTAQISPATSASVFNVVANNQQALKQLDAISATAERGNLFLQGPGKRIDGALVDKEPLSSDALLHAGHTAGLPSGEPGIGISGKSAEKTEPEKCLTCDNVWNGGSITGGQTIPAGGDPGPISNTALPTGGSGTIEYLWLSSTTLPCPIVGDASWEEVVGATSASYDPGPLSQTTCFMRCSRRSGCVDYDGESNVITITVTADCVCPGNLVLNPSFESGTGNWNWWNGTLNYGTYGAQCGLNSGQFQHANSSGWGGAYQDITGIPVGATIALDVYAGVHTAEYSAFVAVEFYNGSTWISGQYEEVDQILPNMTLYSFSATVPANTTKVRLLFYNDWDWVKTDQWCLTVTCNNVTNGGTITGN